MKLIYIILPTMVMAKINISIKPATESKPAGIEATGDVLSRVTRKEQEIFHIKEFDILFNLPRRGYKAPTYAHILDSDYYGYEPVQAYIVPIEATIVGQDEKSVLVAVKEFHNNSTVPIVGKGGIKEDIAETLSTSWSRKLDLSIGKELKTEFANRRISYTFSWGKEDQYSTTKTLSTTSDIEVNLQPGQRVKAIMTATRVTLKAKVVYDVSLRGQIYCQYTFFYIPISGQEFEVNSYLDLMKIPRHMISSEIIDVDYFYGAKIVVKDIDGSNIQVEPALFI